MFFWCDKVLKINSSTRIIDQMFFAKYQDQSGFKFAIDAVHNVPSTNPFIAIYTLNPPGEFYMDSIKTDSILKFYPRFGNECSIRLAASHRPNQIF